MYTLFQIKSNHNMKIHVELISKRTCWVTGHFFRHYTKRHEHILRRELTLITREDKSIISVSELCDRWIQEQMRSRMGPRAVVLTAIRIIQTCARNSRRQRVSPINRTRCWYLFHSYWMTERGRSERSRVMCDFVMSVHVFRKSDTFLRRMMKRHGSLIQLFLYKSEIVDVTTISQFFCNRFNIFSTIRYWNFVRGFFFLRFRDR